MASLVRIVGLLRSAGDDDLAEPEVEVEGQAAEPSVSALRHRVADLESSVGWTAQHGHLPDADPRGHRDRLVTRHDHVQGAGAHPDADVARPRAEVDVAKVEREVPGRQLVTGLDAVQGERTLELLAGPSPDRDVAGHAG